VTGPLDRFSWRIARSSVVLHVLLEGDANMSDVEDVGRLLDGVHGSAILETTSLVVIDLRTLEFMNSSAFKKFVSWIGRVQALPQEKRYSIRFLSDPKMHWQRRSLHVLECFAPDVVTVQT
jgi:hypothetical protein